jgi:hypothetical protein
MEPDSSMVAAVAAATQANIEFILDTKGITDFQISKGRVRNISFYLLRDILRIGDRQDDEISATKFAGYWAFWIRKIKPILYANKIENERSTEIEEVNEKVCLLLAFALLESQGKGEGEFLHDSVRSVCHKPCDGANCFQSYANYFFSESNKSVHEYITYSMAYRTFGPHHMTMLLDQMVFASCHSNR